jgi:hypothetical protein
MQQAGGRAMQGVARIARQGAVDRIANDRMDKARRIVGRQYLHTNEPGGQRDGFGHLHIDHCRRVAQLAAVPKHGNRLSQRHGARIEPTHSCKLE